MVSQGILDCSFYSSLSCRGDPTIDPAHIVYYNVYNPTDRSRKMAFLWGARSITFQPLSGGNYTVHLYTKQPPFTNAAQEFDPNLGRHDDFLLLGQYIFAQVCGGVVCEYWSTASCVPYNQLVWPSHMYPNQLVWPSHMYPYRQLVWPSHIINLWPSHMYPYHQLVAITYVPISSTGGHHICTHIINWWPSHMYPYRQLVAITYCQLVWPSRTVSSACMKWPYIAVIHIWHHIWRLYVA